MFRWQKEMRGLNVPPEKVLELHRSLNSVQLGLPGFPSQQADAYLCLFTAGSGVRAAVILHLRASDRLAVFLNEKGEQPSREVPRLVQEGLGFAESMGFMLGDLDWPIQEMERRLQLWSALTPQAASGQEAPAPSPGPEPTEAARPAGAAPDSAPAPPREASAPRTETKPAPPAPKPAKGRPVVPGAARPTAADSREGEHGATPPAARNAASPPSAEEISRCRQKIREDLGRFLASL